MAAERLTLVVCTYRRPTAVDRLLVALEQQTRPPDEILVVDASPDDATAAVVAGRVERGATHLHHVVVPDGERGLTRQRNRGVALATGGLVAFLDDDTVPGVDYFAQVERCFERHPDAAGVGGAIEGPTWRPATPGSATPRGWYRCDGWERRDDRRWRLRRAVGLAPSVPPGHLPRSGHARPVSFLPPSGEDYRVEFVMGGASAWRRDVFARHSFSPHFEGYGLYEDLDFCIDVARERPLFLCTAATLRHDHDPAARPPGYRYGRMVVENGWYVWRRRWPSPPRADRARWWLTTVVLLAARLAGVVGRGRSDAARESAGRVVGMLTTAPCELSRRYRRRRYGPHARLLP